MKQNQTRMSSRDSLDENRQMNLDRNSQIMKKQNNQLSQLRDYYIKLRDVYHEQRKEASMNIIKYQRAIDYTRRKGDNLEKRINEIKEALNQVEHQNCAKETIEKIWYILTEYRQEVFEKAGKQLHEDNSHITNPNHDEMVAIDSSDDNYHDRFNNNSSTEQSFSHNTRRKNRGNESCKTTNRSQRKKSIPKTNYNNTTNRRSTRNKAFTAHNHDYSCNDDTSEMTISPYNDYSPCISIPNNSNLKTPEMPDLSTPNLYTPNMDTPSLNTPSIDTSGIVTPIISTEAALETPQFCDSIAARRTRRRCTENVYYKEPSLRNSISPGDPFTFSLEDGMVTPTIPNEYSRNTPRSTKQNQQKGRRRSVKNIYE
ncbi:hypothetical protein TRFO_06035 [Tritrichomonas foetus]|uniref:Shugoshin C-terminal domain-containing protein n=1 Tax=Tritrichomonas foetus TaxID=1144522 RepID=A0A1J4K261_9EUKA|nr:hypothetical protein TRFO_06035 [Tritrichomonas foetus]|eukprot:OHT05050.1 hypothetical protein TRFO_06035 [Tritrichomonas foetus]